jgi:hypothetical protein
MYEGAPVDVVEVAGPAATYETDWNHLLGPRPILIVRKASGVLLIQQEAQLWLKFHGF